MESPKPACYLWIPAKLAVRARQPSASASTTNPSAGAFHNQRLSGETLQANRLKTLHGHVGLELNCPV